MGLLRFLFICICLLWIIRMVARFVLPLIFQNLVNKAQQPNQSYNKKSYRQPDGKVRIDYIPPKDKEARAADKAGEFIDYEEIK
ncbi:DUF4834 domain-containing protein [Pedobacter sp. BS3]|uniref:DUF4834 domain-containing protein n=1 Tax=Pedobacter sp. BS3 TaxID=2567937 RepID=UPI0011EDE91D|nr:DUF4834 domain-containing protein [Pedobacter sp. BS3]TZF82241.1 DUF4834 domain-containing protein [Pedobacter sp. BS3]